MHLYIYDTWLNNRKYDRMLSGIETRLTDLGIAGKISRLSPLNTPDGIIQQELRHGITTVVAVGDQQLFYRMAAINPKDNLVYGFIPVKNCELSKMLGITPGINACDTVSSRITKKIDLGRLNNHYFISSASFNFSKGQIICDNQYNVTPLGDNSSVTIKNLYLDSGLSSPADGLLDLCVQSQPAGKGITLFKKGLNGSLFYCENIEIKGVLGETFPVNLDGVINVNTPVKISLLPKKLCIIVGKDRMFD